MKLSKLALFSWVVLGWNILVILWGAYVRASGSGAGCGRHWPTCNGVIIPQSPGIEGTIEFTHRLLSGGAILLVGIMIVWGFRTIPKRHPVRKGLVAAGILILVEALLGAGLVLFELVADNSSVTRALAVSLHLANTFLLVASLTLTAYWASGGAWIDIRSNRKNAGVLGIGLLGMIIIGMSGAVTALGDTLFPVRTLAEGIAQDLDPNAHFLVGLRIYHPLIAIATALYTLNIIRTLYVQNRGIALQLLKALLVIGMVQIMVGVLNLILLVPIPLQLVHLFMAEMVWIIYILATAALLAKPQTLS